jgi:hypothetical protein
MRKGVCLPALLLYMMKETWGDGCCATILCGGLFQGLCINITLPCRHASRLQHEWVCSTGTMYALVQQSFQPYIMARAACRVAPGVMGHHCRVQQLNKDLHS